MHTSFLVAPVFRDHLNQQFMLGARNQSFLTEYVAGMATVATKRVSVNCPTRKPNDSDPFRPFKQKPADGNRRGGEMMVRHMKMDANSWLLRSTGKSSRNSNFTFPWQAVQATNDANRRQAA